MENYMRQLGLVMNLSKLGVKETMLDGIADATLIMEGGYKILNHDDIISILKKTRKKRKDLIECK